MHCALSFPKGLPKKTNAQQSLPKGRSDTCSLPSTTENWFHGGTIPWWEDRKDFTSIICWGVDNPLLDIPKT